MRIGVKSLLFGAHQFIYHPLLVFLAWIKLYGLPNYKETICIIIHDWGYYKCYILDGEDDFKHSKIGANIALRLFGVNEYFLCLLHSRSYANFVKMPVSKLCYADKYSFGFEHWFFYLGRVILTGEIKFFRNEFLEDGNNKEWFNKNQIKMINWSLENYKKDNRR